MLLRLILRALCLATVLTSLPGLLAVPLGAALPGIGVMAYTREAARNGLLNQRGDVYLHDLDHGLVINWTNTLDWHEYRPVWSPDGRALVVTAYSLASADNRLCVLAWRQPTRCLAEGGWYEHAIWIDEARVGFQFGATLTGDVAICVYTYDPAAVPGLQPAMLVCDDPAMTAAYDDLNRPNTESSLRLSADGDWAAIQQTDMTGRTAIALFDQRNTAAQPIRITPDDGGDYFYPAWQP